MKNNWQVTDYHPSSKIWIYTINPSLNEDQLTKISEELNAFCSQWTAHNRELRSFFKIFENRILMLGVDEHLNPASGCSIDKSVHFLEDLESSYSIEIFNRMLFSYIDENNNFITLNKIDFEKAIADNKINNNTLVLNNLALTLQEWNDNGVIPLENSWMKNFFSITI